ncbi:MAG: TRAP transporter substrate-binding protein [Campylobacterales bacterium]|nr:TRAP transporter substrate-binding protein [Campylobacterales bacterium]
MKRRDFMHASLIGGASLVLSGCRRDEKENIYGINFNKGKKTKLTLATSWPAAFPIMGTGIENFAKRCLDLSGGTLDIKIYSKDILVPALQVFDATSSGQIDAFHSGVYYWKGKNSAFSIFGGVPLRHTSEEMMTWMDFGGGYELWREMYDRFNLYPHIGGTTGPQMGGWFKKEIKSLDDLQGLKIRMPGIGGEVLQRLGATPVLLAAAEIYTALERGLIDASEWVGPYLDNMMGFPKIAPYYYKGWHEPGSVLEITFNKQKWGKLSNEHRAIIEAAASEMNTKINEEFRYKNALAFDELEEKINLREFSSEIMDAIKVALDQVLKDEAQKNPDFKRVLQSHENFYKLNKKWDDISTKHFLNIRS